MEKEIVRLSKKSFRIILDEFKKIYTTTKPCLLESVVDCILFMPQSHRLISDFVAEACFSNRAFHHDFVTMLDTFVVSDACPFLSLMVVLNHLENKGVIGKGTVDHFTRDLGLDTFTEFVDFLARCSDADARAPESHGGAGAARCTEDANAEKGTVRGDVPDIETLATDVVGDAGGPGPLVHLKIEQTLREDIKNTVSKFNTLKLKYEKMDYHCLIAQQLISNLQFNINECICQLSCYFESEDIVQLVYAILAASETIDQVDLILLVLSLAKEKGFLKELYPLIDSANKTHRTLCCFIFEQYYNQASAQKSYYDMSSTYNPSFSQEEAELFKGTVGSAIVDEMRTYSSKEDLELFFGISIDDKEIEITEEAFQLQDALNEHKEPLMDQRDFFYNFCLIGSPSISHFLVNLEANARLFDLDEAGQRLFCEVFLDVFKDKRVFRDVLCGKFLKFGVVSPNVAREFPTLFSTLK